MGSTLNRGKTSDSAELRETIIEGGFSISEFLLRRSIPAFRTCRAARERILALQIEVQNYQLFRSIDRQASRPRLSPSAIDRGVALAELPDANTEELERYGPIDWTAFGASIE
ncbi:hypothetical protein Pla123a_43400 [Posidoniimonas polymericola]|uniref:Uncharacterized protein n=1 Tax=Posidoniimonas polymericola TaxID=2528002 RepID=A0A5C5XZK3_9BACT|nr:DUF3422 family protein [Posidoniimonas polymericola]TWT66912.1 hypothetical protein Pla123a_43400 [Posidoniimonas polymericola]